MSNYTSDFVFGSFLPQFNLEEAIELAKICKTVRQIDIYLWIFFAIGVPGNVLTIITTLSMQTLSPATFFVALLAFFDGSALVVKLIYQQLFKHGVSIGDVGCKMEFLAPYLSTVANWMLALICAERFISVCYPLKKISVFTKKRSYICAASVAGFFMILYGTTFMFMRGSHSGGSCGTSSTFTYFWVTYCYWIQSTIFLFIPFLIILICTGGIIRGLYHSRRDRRILMQKGSGRETGNDSANKNNQRLVTEAERIEMAITVMMILAAVLFVLFTLPACVYYVLTVPGYMGECNTKYNAHWAIYMQVQFLLVDATHALNFFLYFFATRRFRSQLFKLLRCKTCKKVTYQHTMSSQLSSSTKANSTICLQQIH